MPKIVTKTYSQQVVEYVKEQLINGELVPGDKLTELSIAHALSISQPPVREAMQILSAEGIVEVKGKRGRYITKLSPKKIQDSYFAGGVLEANVISRALDKFTPEDINNIEKIVEQMKIYAEQNSSIDDFAKLDMQFHEYLFKIGDNSTAKQLWFKSCQAVGKYFFYKKWRTMHTLQEKYERHKEILDALKSKDKRIVEETILDHYMTAGEIISRHAADEYAKENN